MCNGNAASWCTAKSLTFPDNGYRLITRYTRTTDHCESTKNKVQHPFSCAAFHPSFGAYRPRAGLQWLCTALHSLQQLQCDYVHKCGHFLLVAAAAAAVVCITSPPAPVCRMATGFALQRGAANSTVARTSCSFQPHVRSPVLVPMTVLLPNTPACRTHSLRP
jgi:hypothetical protein